MDLLRRLVPTAIRRRYGVKFGIVLLILGLSVGLIGYGATAQITDQVENRVQTDHADAVTQDAQNLQLWDDRNEHTVGMIARSGVVADDDPAAIEDRFSEWKEGLDAETFAISSVDLSNETVVASTNESLRGASITELENVPDSAYANSTRTHASVTDPYIATDEYGQDRVVLSYVQRSTADETRAIVYTVDLEAYSSRLHGKQGAVTMVVDDDSEIILDNAVYGGDHETFGRTYDGATGLVEAARNGGARSERVSSSSLAVGNDPYGFGDGSTDEYVTSSARVFGTDWVVVTHEPADQALGFVNTVNDWGMIATVLGVLVIGMVGAVLGRNTAVSIDRLTDKAGQMEEGNLDVDLETKRIDNIGRLYDGFDSMREALREQIEEAEAAREEAERERERVAEINDHLETKADEYSDVMEAAADGDLTARMTADGDNEAMAEIAADFNEMLEEIERTVADLNRFAADVATASEQVTASSEEVRSASRQVSESVQEISDGADRQNQSLQSVNQEMEGLSTTTEEIAASSNEVADIAERTVNTGQDGQNAAQGAIAAMAEIETEASDAVDEMRRLEDEVQQIDDLINTISEIAHQTNMLALNANIEASRSATGSDDEGFSVVAQEVKGLSEDVAEAADEAENRLESIRKLTEKSAAEVESTSADIESTSEQVQEAVSALEEIADLAHETNVGVQEISAATEQQAASTQEVVAMVDDAATVSEETTAEAENVAAAAEEQTVALTEVTRSASTLSEQAAQLSEALDRFDTDEERAPSESLFEADDGNSDLTDWDGEPATGRPDSDRLSSILESSERDRDRIGGETATALEADATAGDKSTATGQAARVDADAILESDDDTADETDLAGDQSESSAPATDTALESAGGVGRSEIETDGVKRDDGADSDGNDDVTAGDTAVDDGDGVAGDAEADDTFTFGTSDEE